MARSTLMPRALSPEIPTFDSPVRYTLWPVMNADRPAVQLYSP
jgi:hypothetical protein